VPTSGAIACWTPPPAYWAKPGCSSSPGSTIGHYHLVRQLGEGGFGVVFLAEQSRPVRREVALKVIKPGMDTRQVIARFNAEKQALALMNHENIARVLDAGTTDRLADEFNRPERAGTCQPRASIREFHERLRRPGLRANRIES
jgi:hypothetical protein